MHAKNRGKCALSSFFELGLLFWCTFLKGYKKISWVTFKKKIVIGQAKMKPILSQTFVQRLSIENLGLFSFSHFSLAGAFMPIKSALCFSELNLYLSRNFVSFCLSLCATHEGKSLLLNFRCFVLLSISQGIMVALHILGKCNMIQRCNAYTYVFAFPSIVLLCRVDTSAKLITISNEDYKILVDIGMGFGTVST